jgi:hypothetical protein
MRRNPKRESGRKRTQIEIRESKKLMIVGRIEKSIF